MAHERKCMMCGTEYKYCSHCNDFDPTESWKYLYHDKKCKAIANIWYAYRGNEISKEEAKARMSEYKPNIDAVLKYTSIAANEIRDIFDVHEDDLSAENIEVKNDREQDSSALIKETTASFETPVETERQRSDTKNKKKS